MLLIFFVYHGNGARPPLLWQCRVFGTRLIRHRHFHYSVIRTAFDHHPLCIAFRRYQKVAVTPIRCQAAQQLRCEEALVDDGKRIVTNAVEQFHGEIFFRHSVGAESGVNYEMGRYMGQRRCAHLRVTGDSSLGVALRPKMCAIGRAVWGTK